jgi:hypothetical protein
MRNVFLISLCLLSLLACNKETTDLDILVGKWEDVSKQNDQYEEWEMVSANHLRGKGFVMANADTVFIEHLEIKEVQGILTYVAQIPSQNEGQAVHFPLKSRSGGGLVFENMSHDFPQRIIYSVASDTKLIAIIEGISEGEYKEVIFSFNRGE